MSGELQFDLANSTGDLDSLSYFSNYRAKTGSDFVNGYLSSNTGKNQDGVIVYDSIDAGDDWLHRDAGFEISDVTHFEDPHSKTYGLQINVSFENFDWLTNGKLNEFSFSTGDFSETPNSFGVFYNFDTYFDQDGRIISNYDAASFRLDYAKLTLIDVPEPSSLLLIIFGGFVLIIRHCHRHRS